MRFSINIATVLSVLAFTGVNVSAKEILKSRVNTLDVFVPPILAPNATTVWAIGSSQNVTWNSTNAPDQISNRASVILHKSNPYAVWTLASNFSLLAGSVSIVVPNDVTPQGGYRITLFGDSGDISDEFLIVSADASGSGDIISI